ncbi:MAG: hypothetical protein E6J34_09780 [Chloroflexi bacterium]|nr:MAG: hypothetical protein E6J34_09780 [Chloroflexota bacterium]
MAFLALLKKELRLRLRRERTAWAIIIYVVLLSLLGWVTLNQFIRADPYDPDNFGHAGLSLYYLLSMVQLLLILLITPASTASTINGEKERQTFDLLLCSQLTRFSLVAGKIIAGLADTLLLVAASLPIFSFVFFFGGVSPLQILAAVLIYLATALLGATVGIFCSTLFQRPTPSIIITYLAEAIWIFLPFILAYLGFIASPHYFADQNSAKLLFLWHPVMALISTYTPSNTFSITIGTITIDIWISYLFVSLVATVIFFILSMWMVKPRQGKKFYMRHKRQQMQQNAVVG